MPLRDEAQYTLVYIIDHRNHFMQMLFLPYISFSQCEKETCILDPLEPSDEFLNVK